MTKNTQFISPMVTGILFAFITGLAAWIGAPVKNMVWCIYLGFTFAKATAIHSKQYGICLANVLCGGFWAICYCKGGTVLSRLPILPDWAAPVLAEFAITFFLLTIHSVFLKNSMFNLIALIYLTIACIIAAGGVIAIWPCMFAILFGIGAAILTNVLSGKLQHYMIRQG